MDRDLRGSHGLRFTSARTRITDHLWIIHVRLRISVHHAHARSPGSAVTHTWIFRSSRLRTRALDRFAHWIARISRAPLAFGSRGSLGSSFLTSDRSLARRTHSRSGSLRTRIVTRTSSSRLHACTVLLHCTLDRLSHAFCASDRIGSSHSYLCVRGCAHHSFALCSSSLPGSFSFCTHLWFVFTSSRTRSPSFCTLLFFFFTSFSRTVFTGSRISFRMDRMDRGSSSHYSS